MFKNLVHLWVFIIVSEISALSPRCDPSLTTASGTKAPPGIICPGDLIFEDNFDNLDLSTWEHEITLAGGGNWEFQWYTNNRSNSYVADGNLILQPTLTSNIIGEEGLTSATLNLHGGRYGYDYCTDPSSWGCQRNGSPGVVLNPVMSARLRSLTSFAFKYGRVEIRAKIPVGDWLKPSLVMMPKYNQYGSWPASGEIDIMESRGNPDLILKGENIGVEQIVSTLHYGPYVGQNGYLQTRFSKNSPPGKSYNQDFHRYQMEWTPTYFIFSVDDIPYATVKVDTEFWKRGNFEKSAPGTNNPWHHASIMAPFDEEFFLIMNVAVGGVAYFPDEAENPGGKPWKNDNAHPATGFWNGRNQWLPTWKLDVNNGSEAAMKIDYVRVWAL